MWVYHNFFCYRLRIRPNDTDPTATESGSETPKKKIISVPEISFPDLHRLVYNLHPRPTSGSQPPSTCTVGSMHWFAIFKAYFRQSTTFYLYCGIHALVCNLQGLLQAVNNLLPVLWDPCTGLQSSRPSSGSQQPSSHLFKKIFILILYFSI